MKFVCDRCQTRYSIADDKVRQKILKIRCKTCENVITVRDPGGAVAMAAPPPPPPPRPKAAPAAPAEEWFVGVDGVQVGPLGRSEAVKRIAGAKAGAEIFVWRPDFDSWKPPAAVPVLADELKALGGKPAARVPAPPPLKAPGGTPGRAPLPASNTPGRAALPGSHTPGRATLPPPRAGARPVPPPVDPGPETPAPHGFEEQDRTRVQPLDAALFKTELPARPASRAVPAMRPASRAVAPVRERLSPFDDAPFVAPQPPPALVGPMFPPPASAPLPVAAQGRAESGLSRLTGLPGFFSRNPSIRIIAAAAVVVILVGLAVVVLINRPHEDPTNPGVARSGSRPADVQASEKQAREDAEQRFKASVGGTEPATATAHVDRDPKRVAARPAPRPAPRAAAPAPVQPAAVTPPPVAPSVAAGERQVKTFTPTHASTAAAPAAGGGISESMISAVVRKKDNQQAIKICYERALKRDERLKSGRIDVTASVGMSGMVKAVQLSAPPEFSTVEGCIKMSVKRWAFPANSEEYSINFPLILQGSL